MKNILITITVVAIIALTAYSASMVNPQPAPHVATVTSIGPALNSQYYGELPILANNTLIAGLIKLSANSELGVIVMSAFGNEFIKIAAAALTLNQYNESMIKAFINGNLTEVRVIALEGINETSSIYASVNSILRQVMNILPPKYLQYIMAYNETIMNYLLKYNESFLRVLVNNYTATRIVIYTNASRITAGSSLKVIGRLLSSSGEPVINATITLLLNGNSIAITKTSNGGWFNLTISSISVYRHLINLTALFNPSIYSTYLPTRGSVAVTVMFYNSTIIANATSPLWGEPVIIRGFTNGSGRLLIIKIDSMAINATTNGLGFFNASIPTYSLKPGVYTLSIYAEPYGPYAPASLNINIAVNGLKPQIAVQAPPIMFTGVPANVVLMLKPINASGINVTLMIPGGINETVSLFNDSLKVPVKIPLITGSGIYELGIVTSAKPPYSEAITYIKVAVINILQIIIPTLFALLIVVALQKVKAASTANESLKNELKTPTIKPLIDEIKEFLLISYNSEKLNDENVKTIINYVSQALTYVIQRTSIKPNSSETLREYLSRVKDKLNYMEYSITEALVGIYEVSLYSYKIPGADIVKYAESLLRWLMSYEG